MLKKKKSNKFAFLCQYRLQLHPLRCREGNEMSSAHQKVVNAISQLSVTYSINIVYSKQLKTLFRLKTPYLVLMLRFSIQTENTDVISM